MFESIQFCIANPTIEIEEKVFSLGEISTQILNIPKETYAKMRGIADEVLEKIEQFEQEENAKTWFEINQFMCSLDTCFSAYPIFKILKQEPQIFEETKTFLEEQELFKEDCTPTKDDYQILWSIEKYKDYQNHPENYGGTREVEMEILGEIFKNQIPNEPIPPRPNPKTRALLICPGNRKEKWEFYKNYCEKYLSVLYDIGSFNQTMMQFIQHFLSDLKHLDRNQYIAALSDFLNHPRREKFIANPMQANGFYSNADNVILRSVPRETKDGSNQFKIYQYYEVKSLQTLLKLDFYGALEAGFLIRQCAFCGRYFLQKKGYHTKYCDLPNPQNPNYTCAQLGYRLNGVKEAVSDDPKAQSLRRCKGRLTQDLSRGIITKEAYKILFRKAQDLYHDARLHSALSNEDFETMLASKNLYALCQIERKTKRRGRPKKSESV